MLIYHLCVSFDDICNWLLREMQVPCSVFLTELSSFGLSYFGPKLILRNPTGKSTIKPADEFILGVLLMLSIILFVKGNTKKYMKILAYHQEVTCFLLPQTGITERFCFSCSYNLILFIYFLSW